MKISTKLKGLFALCVAAIGITATAAEPEAVQLWEDGPYWATCNVGAENPQGYGTFFTYEGAESAITALGEGWYIPTKPQFDDLISNCTSVWTDNYKGTGVAGRIYTGKTTGFTDKSIFIPACGFEDGGNAGEFGYNWTSSTWFDKDGDEWRYMHWFSEAYEGVDGSGDTHTLRAIRPTPLNPSEPSGGDDDDDDPSEPSGGDDDGPTVTINEVKSASPWDSATGTITIDYSIGGIDAGTDYEVAFEIMAKNETRRVANPAAKLTAGKQAAKTIDTTTLFGEPVTAQAAKVKVTLSTVKAGTPEPLPEGQVQLWENGPIWAASNLGESEVSGHPEYGALYTFDEAVAAVSELGDGWRLPTKDEVETLFKVCTWARNSNTKIWTVSGTGDFESKQLLLPSAGCDYGCYEGFPSGRSGSECKYWPDAKIDDDTAWIFSFDFDRPGVWATTPLCGYPVRAVRTDPFAPVPVASSVAWFTLGPKSFDGAAECVQLWENGPYWAACNVGAENPQDCGDYFKFDDAPGAASVFGKGWIVPTPDDLMKLTNSNYCTSEWTDDYKGTGVRGRIFTGNTTGYTDKSIFLPAAGIISRNALDEVGEVGYYWSSAEPGATIEAEMPILQIYYPQHRYVQEGYYPEVLMSGCGVDFGIAVRPVLPTSVGPAEPDGTKENPWPVGTNTTAYVEDETLFVEGTGVTTNAPWAPDAGGITRVIITPGVEDIRGIVETLPELEVFNDFPVTGIAKAFSDRSADVEPSVEITEACLGTPGSGIVNYTYTVSDLGGKAYDLHIKVSAKGCEKTATIVIENVSAGSVPTSLNVRELLGKAYPNASLFAKLVERTAK